MKIRYIYDVLKCVFHTDFDLVNSPEVLQGFVQNLESIEGITTLTVSRYSVEANIALLFDSRKVTEEIKKVFTSTYGDIDMATFNVGELARKMENLSSLHEEVDYLNSIRTLGIEPSEA